MSKGVFTDKAIVPGDSQVSNVLGTSDSGWKNIMYFLEADCGLRGEWKFYGRNFGWAFRYRKAGKSIAALYPGEGLFTLQIILNPEQCAKALSSDLNPDLARLIRSTQEIAEGRWIYITVRDVTLLDDIKKLVSIRLK